MRFFLVTFILALSADKIHGDVFEECSNLTEQNFVASNKSCAHYIFCQGDESFIDECPEGDYFNSELEMCEPMGDVNCLFGNATQIANSTQSSTSSVTSSTSSTTSSFQIELVNSTHAMPLESTLPPPVDVIVSTMCPTLDDPGRIVLVANPKSCSDYFICYHGQTLAMHCSSMLHFNSNTGKCDHAENVRCLTVLSTVREQCQSHTVDLYPHPTNCNYFYFCRNGYLLLQQCPFFFGWDYEKRSCVSVNQAKCYGNAKRY